MSETPDEIIATAMLLGAEFCPPEKTSGGCFWHCFAGGKWGGGHTKVAAALAYCKACGFELDFNGDLYNTKEK